MPVFEDLVLPHLSAVEGVPESIMPSYDGFGLSNLTATVSHWLGGPSLANPVFNDAILEKFGNKYKNVVVLLVDALGYRQLKDIIDMGKVEFLRKGLEEGVLMPITSISPSTTASALTTLWTAADPNAHGIIGYEMWVKSLSMIINTIHHCPTTFEGDMGSLARAGFVPTDFLGLPTVGTLFQNAGIETHAWLPGHILNSGLSQMHLADTQAHGYVSEQDMLIQMRRLLNQPRRNNLYAYAYWSIVDTLMHRNGTYGEAVTESFSDFVGSLERLFFAGLDEKARKDTLFVLTADHGSVTTPIDEQYNLANHPELVDMLQMMPACEGRLAFLYLKQWQDAAVKAYFDKTWPGQFKLIRREKALAMGLFGKGIDNPDLRDRIGDYVVIPLKPEVYLWWPKKPNRMQGRHGGLHCDEMLVPLLSIPF